MKQRQLEIMLITETQFSSRAFCGTDGVNNENNSGKFQELEEACWNGVLHEILPEVYWKTEVNKKLFLWKVTQADHFLQLEYAERPDMNNWAFSLNPYSFFWRGRLS
ncbi:MAG TPA: hypothetical protein VFI06_05805 [Chitinophagaceae bacterium]|nr:hypothetical protein [Chitinophagaceae bacterium]